MPANPKAGKALLRRLPMEERFGMAQFSHLLGHTELNWRDEIRPSYADPGGGQALQLLLTLTLRRRQWE